MERVKKMDITTKYAIGQGGFIKILEYIKTEGVPKKKVDSKFLVDKKIAESSSNAASIRSVIQAMGLIDEQSIPTEMWKGARTDFDKTMLEGLKKAYPDEKDTLTYEEDGEATLEKYFTKTNPELSSGTIKKCVKTFLIIQAAANGKLDKQKETKSARKPTGQSKPTKKVPGAITSKQAKSKIEVSSSQSQQQPQVAINIQLTVPQDSTGEVYDKFFAAMKR
ncbi:MAG: DUF5343 domain-containing protein, partial [Alphaproteobacteria bacterium]|nr:DUF5343 domain-containing protein [Alphaproteobacteria bacterium]